MRHGNIAGKLQKAGTYAGLEVGHQGYIIAVDATQVKYRKKHTSTCPRPVSLSMNFPLPRR